MKRTTLIWIIVILLLTNIATFVGVFWAKQHPPHPVPPPLGEKPMADRHFIHHLKDSLQLSDNQMQEMRVLRQEFRQSVQAIEEDMRNNRVAMLKALHYRHIDTIQVKHLAAEHGKLHQRLKLQTAYFLIAAQQQLDSVQQAKMFYLFEQMSMSRYHKHKDAKPCKNKRHQ